ncbi:M2 family metallopeptidase [Aggregatilinea lenta]|uniref:M2 family metallopeptidase n=1 Tax=Aggregatilinea lenta TaxID=913108 RepID=UPI000E5B1B03|nr:M2 family metallopeptidase [Aggregatilinea lenta]
MPESVRAAVEETVAQIAERYKAINLKQWEAATTGTPEALDAMAEANGEWMRYFADPEPYQKFRAWDDGNAADGDPLLARQVHLLHLMFAEGQRDPQTIEEMTALQKGLDDAYTNFRAEVDGKRLTANAIDQILATENDSEKRREAWEASKQIGPVVADKIRRLAELRNDAARRMDYANFHRMSLTLNELDPDWLYAMLDELAAKTDAPFRRVKAEMDAELSQRYGVPVAELMPWHYADPFFQRAPMVGGLDYDALFEGKDLVELALKTYDGLGMEVRGILSRSDLYEREGKDQHAFCTHIDREGDVRILCNLQPSLRWTETILHELGHGVYDSNIPGDLPWLLRSFPHILTTEAMAMLMGAATLDPDWHEQVLGASPEEAAARGAAGAARFRLEELIFARWVMVVVNFERGMYEDPSRDLNGLWWDLVQKYQLLNKPEGREQQPDWATKYHIALAPAYYQNYLLGRMMSLQWTGWLTEHAGGIIGRPDAGQFFMQRIFAPGSTLHWNDALEFATGEKLNPDYFVQKFAY